MITALIVILFLLLLALLLNAIPRITENQRFLILLSAVVIALLYLLKVIG